MLSTSKVFNNLFVRCVMGRKILVHPLSKIYYVSNNEVLAYSGVTGKVTPLIQHVGSNIGNGSLYTKLKELHRESNKEGIFVTRVHNKFNGKVVVNSYELDVIESIGKLNFAKLLEFSNSSMLNLDFTGQLISDINSKSTIVAIVDGYYLDSLKAFTELQSRYSTMNDDYLPRDCNDYTYDVWAGVSDIRFDKYYSKEEKEKNYKLQLEQENNAKHLAETRSNFEQVFKPIHEKWLKYGVDLSKILNYETHSEKDVISVDNILSKELKCTYNGRILEDWQFKILSNGLRL